MEEVSDISNVHAQLQISAWQLADVQGIINVFAARRIYAAYG